MYARKSFEDHIVQKENQQENAQSKGYLTATRAGNLVGIGMVGPDGMGHVKKVLEQAGIFVSLKGSDMYLISIPRDKKQKALKLLELSSEEHGCKIDWSHDKTDAVESNYGG